MFFFRRCCQGSGKHSKYKYLNSLARAISLHAHPMVPTFAVNLGTLNLGFLLIEHPLSQMVEEKSHFATYFFNLFVSSSVALSRARLMKGRAPKRMAVSVSRFSCGTSGTCFCKSSWPTAPHCANPVLQSIDSGPPVSASRNSERGRRS